VISRQVDVTYSDVVQGTFIALCFDTVGWAKGMASGL